MDPDIQMRRMEVIVFIPHPSSEKCSILEPHFIVAAISSLVSHCDGESFATFCGMVVNLCGSRALQGEITHSVIATGTLLNGDHTCPCESRSFQSIILFYLGDSEFNK
ncbi:hypothetical protein TNIN_173111 [Trichonephila inaurata madagascariensis]|uniref:Uncharacterized protein n=1 Tax=Trichonephila inaurata madagascariensis TaxID=2747483 RepID=A0A8X6X7N9_9ARAC|nr:hypothetical protein TNIN_173111 [Trichonephila inaurata madagascariensis]